ncbi:MAG: hypothetical protein AAF708_00085 [Deinococcota bacterium]
MNDCNNINWNEVLLALAAPFPESAIEWRAGNKTRDKKKCLALPYADPRVYEARLDEVAPGAWECSFQPWGEHKLICRLTIYSVMRSSTGEVKDDTFGAKGPTAEAQAFKRACSKFGLGRYLYDADDQWVAYDDEKKKITGKPVLRFAKLPPSTEVLPNAKIAKDYHKGQRGTGLTSDGTLSRERAAEMHRALSKLGLTTESHYGYAKQVTGRDIKSLTQLTEDEALRVYNRAKLEAGRLDEMADQQTECELEAVVS